MDWVVEVLENSGSMEVLNRHVCVLAVLENREIRDVAEREFEVVHNEAFDAARRELSSHSRPVVPMPLNRIQELIRLFIRQWLLIRIEMLLCQIHKPEPTHIQNLRKIFLRPAVLTDLENISIPEFICEIKSQRFVGADHAFNSNIHFFQEPLVLFGREVDDTPFFEEPVDTDNRAVVGVDVALAVSCRQVSFVVFPPKGDDGISAVEVVVLGFVSSILASDFWQFDRCFPFL